MTHSPAYLYHYSLQEITYSEFIEYLDSVNECGNDELINELLSSFESSTYWYHRLFNLTPKSVIIKESVYKKFKKRPILPPPSPQGGEHEVIIVNPVMSRL